ncbi:EAL domain-containing protein [bacterium AH-315-K03]|nr:EAL domain-containing protein [bacterium AH-315-K03]
MNIHKKLLLIYSMTTLLVFAIAGTYWAYSNYSAHESHFNQRIESQGTLVANNISAAILFEDKMAALEILSALSSDPAIISAKIFDNHSQLSHSLQFQKKPNLLHQGYIYSKMNYQRWGRLVVPIIESGEQISSIDILYDKDELQQALKDLSFVSVLTTVFALVLGTTLASGLLHSVTKPIFQLSKIAREVTETKNYSLRTEVYHLDEIGELSKDFNSMLGIIEERNNNLEAIVHQRTEQLINNNRELSIQIEEREKSEIARRDSEARFEQAFINAPIGMALIDRDSKLIRYNKGVTALFSRSQLENNCFENIITEDCREEVLLHFTQLIRAQLSSFECEVNCIDSSDNEISVILSISAVNDDKGIFQYGVLQFQDVTESRRLSQDLAYQAQHDALTGLANRRVLNQALADVKKDKRNKDKQHTLCIIDLDQFKTVNDTCGHIAGDELLCLVANEICAMVRSNDLVARIGGDEFAILLNYCDKDEAQIVTENIRKSIEDIHFLWEGNTFRISASIGAMASCLANMDISQVLQKVDSACFAAKDAGRNRVYIIDPEDAQINLRQGQMNWVHRLHHAMENNLFVIHAQPIYSLDKDLDHEYVEILLRLKDDRDGSLISPGAFFPAAERYGVSVNIDQWVVNHLLANMPHYRQAFGDKRSYWVNLSGASISDAKFLSYLEGVISDAKLPVNMLNFEITETSVIRNLSVAKESILRLKALGCQFALDDFGSGMSSFGYLKHLPVDYIKIDGMFVRDMFDEDINMVIVKSIIDIASVMGIKTIAEYVENDDVLFKVKELGASYAQGYSLGRPEELLGKSPHVDMNWKRYSV